MSGGLDAAATARYRVADAFGARVSQRAIEDVTLVISELVTNAVRHAGAGEDETIDVRVTNQGEALVIEVTDSDPGRHPALRHDDKPGGMGLVVVSGLCRDWGARESGDRKSVWAERGFCNRYAGDILAGVRMDEKRRASIHVGPHERDSALGLLPVFDDHVLEFLV